MEFNWWYIIGITALVLFCILPLIFLGLIVFFGATRGRVLLDQIIMPDPERLQGQFLALRQRRKNLTPDQLVNVIITQESFKCALVGFVTGFGGIPVLPLTVPFDALASMRIQSVMVQFIARAYGHVEQRDDVGRVKTYMILAGSKQLTAVTSALIRRLFLRIFLKSALKIVPVIGGLVGFFANYITCQAVGQLAVRWYRGDLRQLGLNDLADRVGDEFAKSPAAREAAVRLTKRFDSDQK
jgi:hypothetical protein